MAEPKTQSHAETDKPTPSPEQDNEFSRPDKPFLKSIGNTPQNGSAKGRPALEEYLEPKETQDFAFTTERIEENYPFFGTLLKRENGLFKRKEDISRSQAKNIEYVEGRYGAGAYQLRLTDKNMEEHKMNFNISGVQKPENSTPETQQPTIRLEDEAAYRRELKQGIREEYEAEITRLERRLASKDEELDEMYRKVRNLTMELAETERSSARTVREEIKEFEREVDQLKEEKRELEFENFELQQDLKYAGVDSGFDIKSILKDAAGNPELMKNLNPLINQLFGGQQPAPQQPAALNSPQSTPQPSRPNPEKPQAGTHENTGLGNENPDQSQAEPEPTQQQQMQHLVKQFSTNIVQTVASSMLQNQPGPEELKQFVLHQIKQMDANGVEIQPGMWIQISKALINIALQNSVQPAKAAETIKPVLSQMNGAVTGLKFMQPTGAVDFIVNQFGIEPTDKQREFLIKLMQEFKKLI